MRLARVELFKTMSFFFLRILVCIKVMVGIGQWFSKFVWKKKSHCEMLCGYGTLEISVYGLLR